jgi:hypothetical protein
MRRRLLRREQLVRSRSRAKNEIHAVLMRRLQGRPPVSDLFGVKGRRWLGGLEFPVEEQETVDGCLRHIEFLDQEIAEVEQRIATEALDSAEIRRLMTVPGVNVIAAATFMAAVGDIRRFRTQRQLVGYLGLDPKVRQSGIAPMLAHHMPSATSRAISGSAVQSKIGVAAAVERILGAEREHQQAGRVAALLGGEAERLVEKVEHQLSGERVSNPRPRAWEVPQRISGKVPIWTIFTGSRPGHYLPQNHRYFRAILP